jgi:hypothetical protein
MAEQKPQDTGINWAVVLFGVILLALAVAVIGDDKIFLRVFAAVAILAVVFYWSRPRQETVLENPLFEQLHSQQHGLDRRKYGRLRSSTDDLLDFIREMNRIAVEGREGKLSPRHAQAEIDRLAAKLRDSVDEIRKAAGVPTPLDEGTGKARPAQPQVVLPKARPHADTGSPSPDSPGAAQAEPPREFYEEAKRAPADPAATNEADSRDTRAKDQPRPPTPPGREGEDPGKQQL